MIMIYRCNYSFLLSLIIYLSWSQTILATTSKTSIKQLTIFHAGSLSVPFKKIEELFEQKYPYIDIKRVPCASRTCARYISDLKKDCDLIAVADYTVIKNLLIPTYAKDYDKFATNEMVIAYNNKSNYHSKINSSNWYKILAKKDVSIGRSNPNHDPCGNRAILLLKLATLHYNSGDILNSIINTNKKEYIRPKASSLNALLDGGEVDYIFSYRSVATQLKFNFITLPNEINLKDNKFKKFYNKASIKLTGKKPNSYITIHGRPIEYAISILNQSKNRELAKLFINFIFNPNYGQKILEANGQSPIKRNENKI